MADREIVTRDTLRRELAVNAATKPLNVVAGAGVAVAGLLLGAWWLLPVAAVVYVVLAVLTFFDGKEAERVGRRAYAAARPKVRELDTRALAPPIRRQVDAARAEAARIDATVRSAELPFDEVSAEVGRLVTAIEGTARRAQRLYEHLQGQDGAALERRAEALAAEGHAGAAAAVREQAAVVAELGRQLRESAAEMEEVNASLAAVHGRLVQAAVTSEASRDAELARDVRGLRERVEGLTDALRQAYES